MLARGPPAGIVRVDRKFALWAYARIRNAVFAFVDPDSQAYWGLNCDVREFLIGERCLTRSV